MTVATASFAQAPPDTTGNSSSGSVTVPALTPVIVRIDAEISSKANKIGDRFGITVAEDVRAGDTVVIPAGSLGEGETPGVLARAGRPSIQV